MKRVPLFLSLAVAVVSLASCEKESENVPMPEPTAAAASTEQKTSLLLAGDWKLAAQTVNSGGAETDLLLMMKPAERDNLAKFQATGVFALDEGATKRDADRPQQLAGHWQLNATADSLTVATASKTTRYAVAELTATTLRLVRTEAGTDGQPNSIFTTVYKH